MWPTSKARSLKNRRRLWQAYRKRIEDLQRRIEEAQKRRKQILLLMLLWLIHLEHWRFLGLAWTLPTIVVPSEANESCVKQNTRNCEPSPINDFAPEAGALEYCDGYSWETWHRAKVNSLRHSKKSVLSKQWKADPTRSLYPKRYQEWDICPNIPQLMVEMKEPYWRKDAFAAIKLQSPPDVHTYLDEAYALEPADIRQCYSERTAEVIANFRLAALRWDERKRREAMERRQGLDLNDPTWTPTQ